MTDKVSELLFGKPSFLLTQG